MAEIKKPDMNGPPQDRRTRFAGGPTRFAPRRDRDDRASEQNTPANENNQTDTVAHDNSPHARGRRSGPRGGPRSGPGGGLNRDSMGGGSMNSRDDIRGMRPDDRVNEKLTGISGNTYEIPQKEVAEQKFSSRCRLYIGNLVDVNEDEVKEMFKPFGEISELFVNSEKMFAFIRLDYRANAERAKRELDGQTRKNRQLKVRFAPVGAAIKVKNLTPWVTNELLEHAFNVFGDIESAHVLVDDRGNSLKEGIVEFARKPAALMALRRCSEGCFFLTSCLRPVIVEPYDVIDDVDGFPEKAIVRKTPEYLKAREVGPRFAQPGTFEYDYGTRWKQLYDLHKQKEESLKRELKLEEEKLEAQMEYAKFEHETDMLREQLRQREMDRERQKLEWEMKERQAEEQRIRDEEMMRRHQEELSMRMHHQEDEMRRRQDNNVFMQMNRPLEPPDQMRPAPGPAFGDANGPPDPAVIREIEALAAAGNMAQDTKVFMDPFDRSRFDGGRPEEPNSRATRWGPGPPMGAEDYHNKRRRY